MLLEEVIPVVRAFGYNWLAKDKDGTWTAYVNKPTIRKRSGFWNNGVSDFKETQLEIEWNVDWIDSLVNCKEL